MANSDPLRQNRCRYDRTSNLGVMMEEQRGKIRTSIHGQSCSEIVAAERLERAKS